MTLLLAWLSPAASALPPACAALARDLSACLATDTSVADCAPGLAEPTWPVYEGCCAGRDEHACSATCAVTTPLALAPVAAPALEGAAATFDDGCAAGGTWCSMAPPTASRLPACTDPTVVFGDVLALALEPLRVDPAWGAVVPPADLAGHPFFSSTYSSGGPDLALALQGWSRGAPLAWELTQEVPCHNCTDFSSQVVLYWPLTGDVVLLDGTFGYDS